MGSRNLENIDLSKLPGGTELAELEAIVERYYGASDKRNERAAIFTVLVAILKDELGITQPINLQMTVEEFGLDSLAFIELGANVQQRFQVVVPPEFMAELEEHERRRPIQNREVRGITVGIVVDWILQQRAKTTSGTSSRGETKSVKDTPESS